jgi:uncharacterized tellurite resistance protein B-like protein
MTVLKGLFNQVVEAISASEGDASTARDRDRTLRMATAVLMIDVARADYVFEDEEHDRALDLIEKHFRLSAEEAAEILNTASEKAEDLVSLHEFTQYLHNNLDEDEKSHVVSLLWQVAYADGRLDKFEDSLVLKISDLLHVNRARVMRLKHDAQVANS